MPQQIIQQYASGKRDDLSYRLARRNAHNADATLSTALGNMLMEPGHFFVSKQMSAFAFWCSRTPLELPLGPRRAPR